MHPFIYISLEMAPTQLDVNVHPTKHEVHFLYEDEIVDKIKRRIELKLLGSNTARTFYKQLRLPGLSSSEHDNEETEVKNKDKERNDKDRVRTDSKEQKLEKFLLQKQASGQTTKSNSTSFSDMTDESLCVGTSRKSKVQLTSVKQMQDNIERRLNIMLRKTLKEIVFVGIVDQTYALFQQETKLFLCNTSKFWYVFSSNYIYHFT